MAKKELKLFEDQRLQGKKKSIKILKKWKRK